MSSPVNVCLSTSFMSRAHFGHFVSAPALVVPELRRPFLHEGGHAFLLVGCGKQGRKEAALEAEALGERRLEGAVDGFLGGHQGRQRHGCDRLGDLESLLHEACGRSGSGPWPWPCRPRAAAVGWRRSPG